MKRVTPKSIQERKARNSDLPKLKDILVLLSVKDTPKVVKKLRLVGPPMQISEVQNKKAYYDPDPKDPKKKIRRTEKVDFPDADRNSYPTRIGHDDPNQCPWRKMGYVINTRYVQKVLEEQEDGTWVHKILVKGPTVFDPLFSWEQNRREEVEDDPSLSTFLGGDSAPIVKITAKADSSKLGGVDYDVAVLSKDMDLEEEHINILRSVRVPSVDELNNLRSQYNEDREEDSDLPEWRDYFEYGHDIARIFKFTPPLANDPASSPVMKNEESEEEDETEAPALVSDEIEEKEEVEDTDIEDLSW